MFERVYARPKWHESLLGAGSLASLGVHAFACAALIVAGADPASIARDVTEGIIFFAPLPSPTAGPTSPSEQLRYVDLSSSVGAMTAVSDLHVGAPAPAPAEQLEEALGARVETPASVFERPADSVYFAEQVDSPAAYDDRSAAPVYPDSLQRLGIEGSVMARFIVDTTGRVEMSTVQLFESTNVRFTQSVLDALPRMLFRPAVLNGQTARQFVEVPFRFRVVAARDTARTRDSTVVRPPR